METEQLSLFAASSPAWSQPIPGYQAMQLATPSGSPRNGSLARKRRPVVSLLQIERMLRMPSVASQLLIALAYELGIHPRKVAAVTIGDLHLASLTLLVGGSVFTVPEALLEDVRQVLAQRMCGWRADSHGECVGIENEFLFSAECWQECQHVMRKIGVSERQLRLAGRYHLGLFKIHGSAGKERKGKEVRNLSPLSLLRKGPMVVRRRPGGKVVSYYLWGVGSGAVVGNHR